MSDISLKPYLVRAIYEWCADAGYTPYISVKVDEQVRVPLEYVKNGEIVLSVSQQATRNLTMGNDLIQFSARFNGVSREISVPVYAVQAIFSRETGHGYFFDAESLIPMPKGPAPKEGSGPSLAAVSGAGASGPRNGHPAPTGRGPAPVASVPTAPQTPSASPAAEAGSSDDVPPTEPLPPDSPRSPPRGGLRVIK